jgi:hypothetical protein
MDYTHGVSIAPRGTGMMFVDDLHDGGDLHTRRRSLGTVATLGIAAVVVAQQPAPAGGGYDYNDCLAPIA